MLISGTTSMGYDGRGNLTASGSSAYTYNIDNMLVCFLPSPAAGGSGCGPNSTTLRYDAAGRLARVSGGGVSTLFAYDGIDMVAEYGPATVLLRRYVHGPDSDDPIAWYEGSSVSNSTRRFLMADERGVLSAFP